jgi:osmotically-inducible protein OsmY
MSKTSDDAEIKKVVEDRLYWDKHVNESEIHVRVADGKVVLEGTVPTSQAQEVVAEHAEAFPGVDGVKNKLTVWESGSPKNHSDADLLSRIQKVVTWNPALGDEPIAITVESGEVTVTGSVNADWKQQQVEKLICTMTGVLRVHNQLRVISDTTT